MKPSKLVALTAVAGFALTGPVAAQEAGAPQQMLYIYQEFVHASMTPQYEANGKELIKMMAGAPKAVSSVRWTAISGPEVGYVYAIPVDGWGGIGAMFDTWNQAVEQIGQDKFMNLMKSSGEAVDHGASYIITLRPDLSYLPETAALTTERPLRHYSWWYAIPGREIELENVAKEYITAAKAKKIEWGWRIYQAVTGPDLPMYLVVQTANDRLDFETRSAKFRQTLGDEDQRLQQKALSVARRVDLSDGMIRPDLSFPPMSTTKATR